MSGQTKKNDLIPTKKGFSVKHFNGIYEKAITYNHHDFLEIYFFTHGEISYQVEGIQYVLQEHDILLVNKGDLHKPVLKNPDSKYGRYVIKITLNKLNDLCTEKMDLSQIFKTDTKTQTIRLIRPDKEEVPIIISLLENLISRYNINDFGQKELENCLLTELFIHINRSYLTTTRSPEENSKINLMIEILQYISENLDKELSIEFLSSKFFISKFYLSREFKKHIGTTIHRYIIQKKLIFAKELIATGLPILELYSKCGFENYCNFFRAFKNEYGVTPHQYFKEITK